MKRAVKEIYSRFPFKRNVFEILRTISHPPEKLYKHLHFHGDFSIKIDQSHRFKMRHYGFQIENELFWAGLNGGWEKTSLSLWMKLVKKADVIFDIGANTGVYSLIARSLNSQAKIFAFEPIERVFEKLVENMELNWYEITCEKSAISNTDGTATVYDTPTEHILSVTVNKNLNDPNTPVVPTQIRTVRLDSYIEQHKLTKIDLLKIDVETHEPEVLEGFGKYLAAFRPTMLIEVLNDEVGGKIESQLKGMGYLYFNIDEASGSIRLVDSIAKSDYYNYLICQRSTAEEIGLL